MIESAREALRIAAAALLLVPSAIHTPVSAQTPASAEDLVQVNTLMAEAAVELLESLNGARRERAQLPFTDSLRMGWAYIPTARDGLLLADMTGEQRLRTHRLLRTAMSGSGYLKVTSIMQLEEVLRAIETSGFARSVEGYVVAIFGDPASGDPWGWRFEGHHVSLNFTSIGPDGISATPLFLGSNPAEVRAGSWTGLRVLAEEEDLARLLLRTLSTEQRSRAIFAEEAPRDIVTRNDPIARDLAREGLPVSEMNSEQRLLLLELLDLYAGTLEEAIAEERLAAIREAGIENLHFGWAGSAEPGEPHYYRIHGPTVLIEFDNVQNDANHIHAVWRDLQNDFGADLLRLHYDNAPHHQNR